MKIFYLHCRDTAATMLGSMRSHSLLSLFLLFISVSLVGCGGSSGKGSEAEVGDGEVIIGLTDAEGDFASYTVDVLSLTLTRANGRVVETLPLSTRVDFAQYTEMTEFLTAAMVPNGAYVKASMVLDYSDADIWVENAAGNAVKVDNIVDTDGIALSQLEVAVNLEGRTKLVIAPGISSHLTLDFDLKASNKVHFDDAGVPTQVVEPFLLADVELKHPKIHRLRGPLASVDVEGSSFEVILRPFHHRLTTDRRQQRRHFGQLEVVTSNTTLFEINGDDYQGQEGLIALNEQPKFTATIVIGDLKLNPRRFEAREVYVGSSVPGGELDVVTGNVIARTGDSLTVKGATLVRAGGSVIFNDEIIVNMGDLTRVKRQLFMGANYDIDDVSVGQRVRVFGVVTNNVANQLEMDAGVNNRGRVKMRLTTLRGMVLDVMSVPEQPLPFVLDLQAIDGRHIGLFDFNGTGDESANDSDPAYYEIDVATLDVSELPSGTPVKVRGFVQSFGQVTTAAPSDFTAHTIVNVSELKVVMTIGWVPASLTAIASSSADSLTFNLDGVGEFHHISRARVAIDLTTVDAAPRIIPRENAAGVYRIVQSDTVQLHTDFANFTADLDARLQDGALVKHVTASGPYDDASATITAGRATVLLE